MKKKNLLISAMLFFSILPLALFASCDKDTNCYLEVLTIDETTKNPISGVTVEVFQDGGNVHDLGVTNGSGTYTAHFPSPAIVKIKATLKLYDATGNPAGERRGETSVRLLEGETVDATITIANQIYY